MKKKKIIYIALIVIFGSIFVILLWFGLRYLLSPALEPGEFESTIVEYGQVIQSTQAKGVIVPENEVVMLSPASSVLQRIVRDAGSRVESGDVILILDPKPVRDDIERIEDQLDVKRNTLRKNRLNARGIRIDLSYNVEVKKLKIASLKSDLADQEQLLEVGGISPAYYEKTKQELNLAEKDLDMLLEKNSIRLQQLEAEEEGLILQIQIQEKELEDKKQILNKMVVRARSAGIVLEVNGKEGEKVEADRLLIRMSNLSNFKINGSMDEKFADLIKTGGRVYALVDNERLAGRIGNIRPVIENNQLIFDVFLENSNHRKLISNLNIDLLIVKAQRDSVLRVKTGPAFGRGSNHEIFVIESDKAIRKNIHTGLKGSEYIEIISGANVGDQLIISDIPAFRRTEEIEIREN